MQYAQGKKEDGRTSEERIRESRFMSSCITSSHCALVAEHRTPLSADPLTIASTAQLITEVEIDVVSWDTPIPGFIKLPVTSHQLAIVLQSAALSGRFACERNP